MLRNGLIAVAIAALTPVASLASDGQGQAGFDAEAYAGAPVPKRKPDLRKATITYEDGKTTICFSNCGGLTKNKPRNRRTNQPEKSGTSTSGKKGGGGKKAAKKAVKKALDYASSKDGAAPKALGKVRNNFAAEFIVMTGDVINRLAKNAKALSRYGEAAVGDNPAAAHDKMSESLNSKENKK